MAPNRARRRFFPTDPDLADILGRTDLDCENFYFFDLLDPSILDLVYEDFWFLEVHTVPQK